MRKNFIVWSRTPCCAFFEIMVPVFLMIVLSVIRLEVPTFSTDQSAMLDKKLPAFPGVGLTPDGTWGTSTDYNFDNLLRPFFTWANYSESHDHFDPTAYQMSYDTKGPQYYSPGHCMRTFDYQHPGGKQPSPFIAIIGEQTNLTDTVSGYYYGLKKTQRATAAWTVLPPYAT